MCPNPSRAELEPYEVTITGLGPLCANPKRRSSVSASACVDADDLASHGVEIFEKTLATCTSSTPVDLLAVLDSTPVRVESPSGHLGVHIVRLVTVGRSCDFVVDGESDVG